MIYQESDDLIGMGDFKQSFAKFKKGAKKFRSFVKKTAGKFKGKSSQAQAAISAVRAPVSDSAVVVESSAPGGMDFVKKNLIPISVGGLLLLLLVTRKRG